MDRISDFLNKTQEDYQCELLAVEQNAERLNAQIAEYHQSISDIEASIDHSYAVMSASGSVDDVKRAEIHTLRELLKTREVELAEQNNKKVRFEKDIVQIQELIQLYEKQVKALGRLSSEELISKLDFISRLIQVDAFRAIEEIEQLKSILSGTDTHP